MFAGSGGEHEWKGRLMPNASAVVLAFLFAAAFLTSCDERREVAETPRRAVMLFE